VLPGQQPQWLPDNAYTIGDVATPVPLSWNQTLNWLGNGVVNGQPNSVPNSPGAVANFFRTNTAARTVTLDGNKTIGTLTFNSPNSYTISAGSGGSILFNNSGNAAIVAVSQGSHSIAVPVQLQDNLSVTAGNVSAVLSISGVISGSGALLKAGSGTLALAAVNSYAGDTTVQAGTLRITNRFLADSENVLLSTGATLDLQFSGSADMIGALLIDGEMQVTGLWGAVGNPSASFHTPLITGTGVLQVVAGPVVGDYNKDGKVDASDYVTWRSQLGAATIANRDPNIAGVVGQSDYDSWRAHFGQTAGTASGVIANAAVPEPTTTAMLMFAAAAWRFPRRRSPH
jgi:autotransporter-associated beta strand protein